MKRTAARGGSTHFVWATSSLAIVVAMIFLGGAAALLTAREDVQQTPISYKTTTPPRTVKKETAPLAAAQTSVAETPTTVTIAGCLENDEGTFMLTEPSGTSAPASRSWKSGFLKKRPAPIELSDRSGTLNLRQYIGRRIAATGTLIDREMRALSVRRVGSCE